MEPVRKLAEMAMLHKSRFLFPAMIAVCLIAGCSTGKFDMTPELAQQIAVDASGCPASQVKDLQAQETDGKYLVTFNNASGKYSISVDANGKVSDYTFTPSEKKTDQNKSDKKAEKQPADKKTDPENQKTENQTKNDTLKLPEGSLSQSELISRAAALIGVTNYTDQDFKTEVTQDKMVSLTYQSADGIVYTILLDPATGTGTYTYASAAA